MLPAFDKLSDEELEQLRRFIEESDYVEVGPEMRDLIEKRWPWLLFKVSPPSEH
jgi:hypothetical protein